MTAPAVLVIGFDPYRVPVPDPDGVAAALERGRARFGEFGMAERSCLIGPDDRIESDIVAALGERPWDCVVVGGGIRKPPEALELFERVVNLVRRHAPQAALAFNSGPGDSADAAARVLGPSGPGAVTPG